MTLDEQLEADPDMLNPAWVGVDPFQDHQAARRFLFHDCDEPTARWASGHCPHVSRPAALADV
jgi:hypothetical protein